MVRFLIFVNQSIPETEAEIDPHLSFLYSSFSFSFFFVRSLNEHDTNPLSDVESEEDAEAEAEAEADEDAEGDVEADVEAQDEAQDEAEAQDEGEDIDVDAEGEGTPSPSNPFLSP